MESPLERVTLALREAIAQAREDGAKLPGSKGRLLEAQALRWRRALAGIDAMRPVAQPPDPDLPELLRHLERRAIDDDACGREDDADRLRRCAARLLHLTIAPRPRRPDDILDADRLRRLTAALAFDPAQTVRRLGMVRSLDAMRALVDGLPEPGRAHAAMASWPDRHQAAPTSTVVQRDAPARLDA